MSAMMNIFPSDNPPLIKIVGVCGSGKTTLAERLRARGYDARQVSQEHSGVPDLWRRRNPPAALIYLDAGNDTIRQRYPRLDLHDAYLAKERARLAHAKTHADCAIDTSELTKDEVLAAAVRGLGKLGLTPPNPENI